jgi:thymidine kinase
MSSLYFIHAPMNSSKSAQLLMTAHNYEERNHRVLIVKPAVDTRDGVYVQSRALDVKREVDLVITPDDHWHIFKEVEGSDYAAVLVDEAQFLTAKQVDELGEIVDDLNIPVLAYGLRTDAFSNLFEGSKRLLEIADKFQELKTICPCCGKKAIINMRLNENNQPVFDGEQVSPGTHYLPVCRKYFKKLQQDYLQGNNIVIEV